MNNTFLAEQPYTIQLDERVNYVKDTGILHRPHPLGRIWWSIVPQQHQRNAFVATMVMADHDAFRHFGGGGESGAVYAEIVAATR